MKREKWLVYEKYTGKILAVAWSYERAERRAIQLGTDCIKRDNYLPEWGGKNWKKGDILPLRNK